MIPPLLRSGPCTALTFFLASFALHVPPSAAQEAGPRGKYQPAVKLPDDFVRYARVPDGGIQPRVALAGDGLAVLYFKGDEAAGDLYLARSKDEAKTFEPAQRLNAAEGAVLALDVGHSGSIAVDAEGRTYVAWVEDAAKPALRFVAQGKDGALAPVQDLGSPPGLSRSTTIALDAEGKILLFYAAQPQAAEENAAKENAAAPGLRIWMRTSSDGSAFDEPVAIDEESDGVCVSSSMSAHVDSVTGAIQLLYVTAGRRGGSEVRLLTCRSGGSKFHSKVIENATFKDAPPRAVPCLSQESPTARTVGKPQTIAIWDTYAQVFWGAIDPESERILGGLPVRPRGEGKTRRTRAVGLASGTEFLLAWIEQPKGERTAPGTLAWQVWYQTGLVPMGWGQAPDTAGASTPAVFANHDHGFTILY